MKEKIIVLDFGSPTTQLIGRRIRELNTFCEIVPYNKFPENDPVIKGVVLSGSPYSVTDKKSFHPDISSIRKKYPVLGICYGAQYLASTSKGAIESTSSKEFCSSQLSVLDAQDPLFKDIASGTQAWMSNGEIIRTLPADAKAIADFDNCETAAFKFNDEPTWGVQFFPENDRTQDGTKLLDNFLTICDCEKNWTPSIFIESTVEELRNTLGNDKVILAVSGGLDSSVAAFLLHKAIGSNLTCILVDHGLLRKNEFLLVLMAYQNMGLNVIGIDAREQFYNALEGVTNPEEKRKIIGKSFIDVFEKEASQVKDIKWLGQGTVYTDVIESLSITGSVIKSHHNVGGLPEKMNLRLVEPLRLLFKDEVRRVGQALGLPKRIIGRHPFPGPGLGVRILGKITPEKAHILQEADDIFISLLRKWNLYESVWQAGAILLPVNSVGVSGAKRTYENTIVLRAVNSTDAMTADWSRLPYDFLSTVSNEIISKVEGVNRVVFDISSKPPATIEWE